jgi:hypothetical protein
MFAPRVFAALVFVCYAGIMVLASATPDNPNRVPYQEYYEVYDPSTFWDNLVLTFQFMCVLGISLCMLFVGLPGMIVNPCAGSLFILIGLSLIRLVNSLKQRVKIDTVWYCRLEEDRFNPNDISNLWKLQ